MVSMKPSKLFMIFVFIGTDLAISQDQQEATDIPTLVTDLPFNTPEVTYPTDPTGICCGATKLPGTDYIINGTDTTMNKYPWIADITIFVRNGHHFYCGGSLIASQWILTAQHCINPKHRYYPSRIMITLGEHEMYKRGESPMEKSVIVDKWFDYDDNLDGSKDIALIKLLNKQDLNIYTPICLPEINGPPMDYTGHTGSKAWIYGWGRLKHNGKYPNKLQEVEIDVIQNEYCYEAFNKFGHYLPWGHEIKESQMCAGVKNENHDACKGDSGVPLSIDLKGNNVHQQIGIVSYGKKCGITGLFGVYANVTYFMDWIIETMTEHTDDDEGRHLYPPCNSA